MGDAGSRPAGGEALRRFAIVGHEAGGPVILNDLAGGSGRLDVLLRAVNTALLLSHGMRRDTIVDLVLDGGPRPRLLRLVGAELRGWPAEERGMGGHLRKVLAERLPPPRAWAEISPGFLQRQGTLADLLDDWANDGVTMHMLDAEAPSLWADGATLGPASRRAMAGSAEGTPAPLGFILSDHRAFNEADTALLAGRATSRSLGDTWQQGHVVIALVHALLDWGVQLR